MLLMGCILNRLKRPDKFLWWLSYSFSIIVFDKLNYATQSIVTIYQTEIYIFGSLKKKKKKKKYIVWYDNNQIIDFFIMKFILKTNY